MADKSNHTDNLLLQELRQQNPDFYALCLFAPAAAREELAAVFGFMAALMRVREQVSEPIMGQIRLQWWRDGLDTLGTPEQPRHATLDKLQELQQRDIPVAALHDVIDARESDLAEEPHDDESLRDYLRDNSQPPALVAAAILRHPEQADLYAEAMENYLAVKNGKNRLGEILAVRQAMAALPRKIRREGLAFLLLNDLAYGYGKGFAKHAPLRLGYLLWRAGRYS